MINIRVDDVAWSGGKILKWRAMATLFQGRKQVKHIYGEPEDTPLRARLSLLHECKLFRECAEEAIQRLQTKIKDNDFNDEV